MTDTQSPQPRSSDASPKAPDRRPTLGSKPAFWPTIIIAGASFLLLFEFLAFQLAHGNDPAIGALKRGGGETAAPRPGPPRRRNHA